MGAQRVEKSECFWEQVASDILFHLGIIITTAIIVISIKRTMKKRELFPGAGMHLISFAKLNLEPATKLSEQVSTSGVYIPAPDTKCTVQYIVTMCSPCVHPVHTNVFTQCTPICSPSAHQCVHPVQPICSPSAQCSAQCIHTFCRTRLGPLQPIGPRNKHGPKNPT